MKKVLMALALLAVTFNMKAEDKKDNTSLFYKGVKVAQAGIGFGGIGIPVGLGLEYGATDKIGIGGFVGFASKSYPVLADKYRVTSILIAARGNYHFYMKDKIDAYGGLCLGYNVASAKWVGSSTLPITASYGGLILGGQLGARYYFNPSIAVFGEVGYGIGYLTLGVAKKF